jgi:hypothetical protein
VRLNSLIFLSVILLYSCVTNAKPYPVNKQEVVVKNPSGLAEPITIYKTSGRGPGILKWHKHLEPGFYVLQVMIKTGNCRRDFVVNVDSNIIGTRIGYFSQENVSDVFIHNFNFNIVNSGVHTISIKRFQVIHWYGQHEEL